MISDTHGGHRAIPGGVPEGDILIHAGDFTRFGREDDARDFNSWLGELPHRHKFVVNGNHEHNAEWQKDIHAIVSNATVLVHEGAQVELEVKGGEDAKVEGAAGSAEGVAVASEERCGGGEEGTESEGDPGSDGGLGRERGAGGFEASARGEKHDEGGKIGDDSDNEKTGRVLKIWGTNFFWPMTSPNPFYAQVPADTDIIICHGPVKGHVDGGKGCQELARLVNATQARLVVSGHIHSAHGVAVAEGVTYVNAANARKGHGDIGWGAVVLDV
jgi:hypothetical protein